MQLGIMAKTLPRPRFEEALDAIADLGLTQVRFNLSCIGLPTLPERIDQNSRVGIARLFRERGLTMAAISGTFNLCDPDPARLAENLRRLDALAAASRWLDTRIITLRTGTRDPVDRWKWHPENVRRSAWDSLVASMREAVRIADRHEVILAFEPERHNVVHSVARARMLLDTIASPWLKVVLDPANLRRQGELDRCGEMVDEALDWLGPEVVLVHAKPPETGIPPDETMSAFEGWQRDSSSPLISVPSQEVVLEGMKKTETCRDRLWSEAGALSPRLPRHLLEVERFFRSVMPRLAAAGYGGAVVMRGMAESEVAPLAKRLAAQVEKARWGN